MTPDKIKEAFEAWAKFLEDDFAGYIYSEQAWQACAEWMLSRGEKEFDLVICSEWQGTLTEYELSQVKNVWMIARLSSAKEIASLKDQILRYEQDNRELRAKGIKEIAEKDARIKQLESMIENGLGWEDMKNETTYPNG
jgi:phage-related protein